MAASPFAEKREVYRNSTMKMTRRLAEESEWNEDALERRADDLARRVLKRWPWSRSADGDARPSDSAPLRWRLDDEPWRNEQVASQMVLNVAGALLSRDPENAKKLSGEAISSNIHPASRYAPGSSVGAFTLRPIPGHGQFVMYPYASNYPASARRCRTMGDRCRVQVEVAFSRDFRNEDFWRFLKERTGGLPGQKDTWRGAQQWTSPVNRAGDCVGVSVGDPDYLRLHIRAGETQASEVRAARMNQYSRMLGELMGDQEIDGDLERTSSRGNTLAVTRAWVRDDRTGWLAAAQWIKEQHERLRTILMDSPSRRTGPDGADSGSE